MDDSLPEMKSSRVAFDIEFHEFDNLWAWFRLPGAGFRGYLGRIQRSAMLMAQIPVGYILRNIFDAVGGPEQ